jgi:hypothetical protein
MAGRLFASFDEDGTSGWPAHDDNSNMAATKNII